MEMPGRVRPDILAMVADILDPPKPTYQWRCDRDECDGRPHEGADYDHGRTKQRAPLGNWKIWLLLCGRGFGKTRTASEAFLDRVLANPVDDKGRPTWHLIGSTTHTETTNLMIKGPSSLTYAFDRRGIANVAHDKKAARWYSWNKNDGMITLSTGQIIVTQHAEGNADFGRGGEWATVWLDEFGMFKRIKAAWEESLPFSSRVKLPGGARSVIMVTTTPKASYVEPFTILKKLVAEATATGRVRLTRGTTWENADNIPEEELEEWEAMYPLGTRTRRQELDAELLDNVEGSLWTQELIDSTKTLTGIDGEVIRRYVGLDPAFTNNATSDLAGICLISKTMGLEERPPGDTRPARKRGHYWVEKDITKKRSTTEWARAAVQLAHDGNAVIIYEANGANDPIADALRQAAKDLGINCPRLVPVKADASKSIRAGIVVGFYEQGRVHHVGHLPELELEMTTWVPENTSHRSPNRIDAMVHAVRYAEKAGAASGGYAAS